MSIHDFRVVVGDGRERCFSHPHRLINARTAGEAQAALHEVDAALTEGYFVAGFLSFELGYACVGLGNPHAAAATLPLLSLGVFSSADGRPPEIQAAPAALHRSAPRSRVEPAAYRRALALIAHDLAAGDVYQVNFTVPFDFDFSGDAFALYRSLASATGAPYAMYLEAGDNVLASLSPELFLRFNGDEIITKPMKGTTELDRVADLASAKNRAEHLMIVDLLRNDLARVCSAVRVERLFEVERYPTFATMTSTIIGTRASESRFATIIEAMFPCGSVTGAPKRSAMQRIGSLERQPRGAYCGSIGYLGPDGHGIWNVAIRTLQLNRGEGRGRLDVGGGIVADSIAEDEWAEVLVKAAFFASRETGDETNELHPPLFEI